MALKRFVDGAARRVFFQKRAPGQPARLDRDGRAVVPVRPDRRRGRPRDAGGAGLGRQPRLHRPQPAPGPGRGPRPPRRAAGRPRPGARACAWSQIREVALVAQRGARGASGSSAGRRPPARAASTSTSGSSRAGRTPRSAARRSRWPATSSARAPSIATSKWWKEERHGVFLDYNQNAKDRTVASAYSVRPLPDARVSMPLRWDEVADVVAGGLHARDGAGDRRRARRRRRRDRRGGRVARGAARAERPPRGGGPGRRARGRRTTRSRRASRRGSSRRGPAGRRPSTSDGRGVRAGRRRRSRRSARPRRRRRPERRAADRVAEDAARGTPGGSRPTPTGRRKTSIPVIEISRAATKEEALEGLERWKARHPEAAAAPGAGRRPGRRDARPLVAVVPRPGQPDPRAGGGAAAAGSARPGLRPVGRATSGRTGRPAGARAPRRRRPRS